MRDCGMRNRAASLSLEALEFPKQGVHPQPLRSPGAASRRRFNFALGVPRKVPGTCRQVALLMRPWETQPMESVRFVVYSDYL